MRGFRFLQPGDGVILFIQAHESNGDIERIDLLTIVHADLIAQCGARVVHFSNVRVHVRGGGPVPGARMAWLFPFFGRGDGIGVPACLQIRNGKQTGAWKQRLEVKDRAKLLDGGKNSGGRQVARACPREILPRVLLRTRPKWR
jgi:hypothetical protein